MLKAASGTPPHRPEKSPQQPPAAAATGFPQSRRRIGTPKPVLADRAASENKPRKFQGPDSAPRPDNPSGTWSVPVPHPRRSVRRRQHPRRSREKRKPPAAGCAAGWGLSIVPHDSISNRITSPQPMKVGQDLCCG